MKQDVPRDESPDEATRRELVDPVRKWGPRLARAIFVLVLVLAVIGYKYGSDIKSNTNDIGKVVKEQATLIADLEHRQYLGCHRTNIERRVNNVQNYADYQFFAFTYTAFKRQIEHPERATTPREQALGKRYIAGLRADLNKKAYVPLTFCTKASKTDLKRIYEPPTPVAFHSVHGKKQREALKRAFKLQVGQ